MIPQVQKMILGSNVFIEAKNRYYAFDIYPGYWDFVLKDFMCGNAVSIAHVWNEVAVGEDELTEWMKGHLDKKRFFDCAQDSHVVANYRLGASYVKVCYGKPNVVRDFLQPTVADPWLVAYALTYGGNIVTQETAKNAAKKSRLLMFAIILKYAILT